MNEAMENEELEYVGFWARVLASIVDCILWAIVSSPLLWLLFDHAGNSYDSWLNIDDALLKHSRAENAVQFFIDYLLPAIVSILFWLHKGATPGKMLLGARVVDANTGLPLTMQQAILRYLGYFVSAIPFLLGLIWVGWDARKQGWHDKIAGSVVVRSKTRVATFTPQR